MRERSLAKAFALTVAGLLVFILYLYFFVGISDMIEVFRRVNPYSCLPIYFATIVAMVLSMLFYSMSWNTLLKALSVNAGLKKAFIYCWLGNFVDLIIPLETISGEVVRTYLVQRDSWDPGRVVASVIAHRIITVFVTLSSLLAASLFLFFRYEIGAEILYLLAMINAGSLTLIVLLLYVSLREEAAEKIVNAFVKVVSLIVGKSRLNPSEARKKVYQSLIQFHSGFKSFGKRLDAVAKSVAYGFVAWVFHLSVYLLVFYALGFNEISMKVVESIVVYAVSLAVQSAPIALPLGLVEIVMTKLYTLFNIPTAIGGVATLLIRAVTFWFQIAVGYVLAQWIGVKELIGQKPKETSTC